MLPMGSIFFPLKVAPFKDMAFSAWKQTLPLKSWFIDTGTKIQKLCVHLLLLCIIN